MLKFGFLLFVLVWTLPFEAHGQGLLNVYQQGRFRARVEEVLDNLGRKVPPRPSTFGSLRADAIAAWVAASWPAEARQAEAAGSGFTVTNWRKVQRLERGFFSERYHDTDWTSEGLDVRTSIDTVKTDRLRSKLQALYGAPTQTIVEIGERRKPGSEEFIQFEYWFVVNDSIPLRVMDVDGPFQNGLVLVGAYRHKPILGLVKEALARQIAESAGLAPYLDYYYSYNRRAWYLTGYDGVRFFVNPTEKPDFTRGRPRLQRPNGVARQ